MIAKLTEHLDVGFHSQANIAGKRIPVPLKRAMPRTLLSLLTVRADQRVLRNLDDESLYRACNRCDLKAIS
jgi:hypothetical protein